MFTDENMSHLAPWLIRNSEIRLYMVSLMQLTATHDVALPFVKDGALNLIASTMMGKNAVDIFDGVGDKIAEEFLERPFEIPDEEERQTIGAWLKHMMVHYNMVEQDNYMSDLLALMGGYLMMAETHPEVCPILLMTAILAVQGELPADLLLNYNKED